MLGDAARRRARGTTGRPTVGTLGGGSTATRLGAAAGEDATGRFGRANPGECSRCVTSVPRRGRVGASAGHTPRPMFAPALALLALGADPGQAGAWSALVPGFSVAARSLLASAQGEQDETTSSLGPDARGLELGAQPDDQGPTRAALQPATLSAERLNALAADVSAALAELAGLAEVPELDVQLSPRSSVAARARLEVDRAFPPVRRGLDEAVAKALGMLPREVELGELYWRLLADEVGGVRDSVTGEIFIVEDATPNLARLVLAHETAQHIGELLDGNSETPAPVTTDERLATAAVREARNMLLVAAWVRQHLAPGEIQALVAEEHRRSRATDPLPPFVWKPILGLYSQGQAFLARQARYGPLGAPPRPEDVARASAMPPRTTEELLHPARYWSLALREEPTPVEFTDGLLPDGWSVVHVDSLGELVLALFTTLPDQRHGLAASALGIAQTRFTNAAADGWDGDRVVLARGDDDAQFVRLATRWDDDEEAREFAAAARSVALALELDFEVEQRGHFVVVTAASGVNERDWSALNDALRVAVG